MAQNLQLVVQIAKEYTEQLGADKIIALLEGVNSYNGLYYYLGAYLAFSEDPEVCGGVVGLLHDASETPCSSSLRSMRCCIGGAAGIRGAHR